MNIKIGFCSMLSLLLIMFKIIGVLNISWFWALSPVWITCFITIFLLGLAATIGLIIGLRKGNVKR